MAQITGAQNERVFQIKQWLGLNENPDGDTKLKIGEAAVMRNWRVTKDGNLQKRPGTRPVLLPNEGQSGRCAGAWTGIVGGEERVMLILGEYLYSAWDTANETWALTQITPKLNFANSGEEPLMFGFADRLYILTGLKYYVYSGGATLSEVDPYVPLIEVALTPLGAGTLLEQINRLTMKRRVWLSPDGESASFQLPETPAEIVYAKYLADGSALSYSLDRSAAKISFAGGAPAQGVNTIEVCYRAGSVGTELFGMKYAEMYNGDQDNRVFLYGNGTNKAYYSGVNYNGEPDASYFPELNEMAVGDTATPITAMIRYNSRLLCFKSDSTYTVQYGQMTLTDGSLTAAFYLTPVHKSIGCTAPGQAQMVMNSPVVPFGHDLLAWSGNRYGNMTADERQVKRISDRVPATLRRMDFSRCASFDDNDRQEYYLCDRDSGAVLVWNYASDAWYLYDGLYMDFPFSFRGGLYYATSYRSAHECPAYDGEWGGVQALDEGSRADTVGYGDSFPICCEWESGSMSFGADYQRKYSAMLWLGVKPAQHASVTVTVKTDRASGLAEKVVANSMASFAEASFRAWSFNTSNRPTMKRLKIKAKKFIYYKLILESNTDDSTATVTAADIRVRFTGYAK